MAFPALAEPFVFQPAEPIAHRHSRSGGVPIHVGLGAGTCEAKVFLQMSHGLFIAVSARLESKVDEDAVAAPERIMKLLQAHPWRAVDPQIDEHLLTPECPAFVKDGVRKEPPPAAPMAIGGDELQMMPRIAFMGAG